MEEGRDESESESFEKKKLFRSNIAGAEEQHSSKRFSLDEEDTVVFPASPSSYMCAVIGSSIDPIEASF